MEPAEPVEEAGNLHAAGQVWHRLHLQVPEPERSTRHGLHGRVRAAQPRGDRDGTGLAHQDDPSGQSGQQREFESESEYRGQVV